MTLHKKILTAIGEIIPEEATYSVSFIRSGVMETEIVRVVTSAWKTLPAFIRVMRVQNAVRTALTPYEQQKILRVSVLTPQELIRQAIARTELRKKAQGSALTELARKLRAKSKQSAIKTRTHDALIEALGKLQKKR